MHLFECLLKYTKLYIIGNGFDLHHGINSKYSDFEHWLCESYPDVYNKINQVYECCDAEWWSDFENQLACLNADIYSSNKARENMPDLLSDHCDAMWEDAQIAVENELNKLFQDIRDCFHDWIEQLNPPIASKKIKLDKDNSLFLNFNYTRTLEDIYNVNTSQILHIHGCIYTNEEFILGHGKTYEELKRINEEGKHDPSDEELHKQLAEEAVLSGVASQQKPVEKLIKDNWQFFEKLIGITDVYVYGLSLSEVDTPYLNLIVSKTQSAHWHFSDHRNYNTKKIDDFCKKNQLVNFSIVDLNELIDCPTQLELEFHD